MRLVLSIPRRNWGGASSMTVLLADGLSERGHRVAVLCSPFSPLPERLSPDVRTRPVLRGKDFPPLPIARAALALRRLRADAVVSLTGSDLRMTVPAAALLGIRCVACRVSALPGPEGPVGRRITGRLVAHHVAPTRAVRDLMLAREPWIPPDKISVIENGISVERFARGRPADLGLPPSALAVGFVGRLDSEKGLPDLAEAWPEVADRLDGSHLVVVGEGGLEEDLRRRLAGAPRVRWLGFRSDVPAVMRALDVLVLPSHTEAFGLAAAEAMAAGVPVVCTDVEGLAEVVRHGVDGLRVPPRDPARLAEAIVALGSDPEARRRMGRAGRERARSEFGRDRVVDRYASLLRGLVAGGRDAAESRPRAGRPVG